MTTPYRPLGLNELTLIGTRAAANFLRRLPDRPIFYPLSLTPARYAAQITRGWNRKSSSYADCIASFKVDEAARSKFDRHIVSSDVQEEYWIPARELPNVNSAIRGLPFPLRQVF